MKVRLSRIKLRPTQFASKCSWCFRRSAATIELWFREGRWGAKRTAPPFCPGCLLSYLRDYGRVLERGAK